jgi:phosphoglycerate dehydrogenase-like enzyme
MIDADALACMGGRSVLVNIARGQLINTDALVDALRERRIGAAALDSLDPEPLPEGHPLWQLDNCLVTPHVACGYALGLPLLGDRFAENLRRWRDGQPLIGVVDLDAGY